MYDARPTVEDKVGEWLRRISYKPNFTFKVMPWSPNNPPNLVQVDIAMRVPDSRNLNTRAPHILAAVTCPVPFEALENFNYFQQWLHDKLLMVEEHELDEWFKVDGMLIRDPHATGGK